MKRGEKTYLGDAVSVEWDGYHVTLTVSNGIQITDTIHLEPDVQIALVRYFERMMERGWV